MLSRDDGGLYNETLLLQQQDLLHHPAILSRRQTNPEAPVRNAVEEAIADVGRWGETLAGPILSEAEHEAVKMLLGITPPGTRLRKITHADRAEAAFMKLAGHANGVDLWRRKRADGGSDETDLLARFIRVLDRLDAPPSATRGISRTPPTGSGELADVGDLHGTWAGRTESTRVNKDRSAGRTAPTFMVIDTSDHEPVIRWYYRDGWAWSVSVRALSVAGSRRLLIMYESDVSFEERKTDPWHRGACLLEAVGASIAGPYWSDRRSHGLLIFSRKITDSELAATWEDAARLDQRRVK
ncbi:hypothetical protein [Blastococcus atacamensis]|uniref:hypothetical protein n=1 Tax=Blastococcus atacamensis TaxID=2070508 RepID=UPI000CEC05A2|nr:hypothetical protein [Blastococcus atacamensis]